MEHALAERFPRTLPSSSIRPSGTDSAPGAGPLTLRPFRHPARMTGVSTASTNVSPNCCRPTTFRRNGRRVLRQRTPGRGSARGPYRMDCMRRISEAMELLTAESREKAGQLEARADAADREISELREEMRNMRLQMDTAEKTQQADIEQLRALLLRVTRKLTEREA